MTELDPATPVPDDDDTTAPESPKSDPVPETDGDAEVPAGTEP